MKVTRTFAADVIRPPLENVSVAGSSTQSASQRESLAVRRGSPCGYGLTASRAPVLPKPAPLVEAVLVLRRASQAEARPAQGSENPPYGAPQSAHDPRQCEWAAISGSPDGQDFLGPQSRIEVRASSAGVFPGRRPLPDRSFFVRTRIL
jgi:hypothetical protein